jgi:rhodanese-related sulfurtransferase
LFGGSEKLNEYLTKKAVIIDVRTKEEYNSGHVKNAVNVPLDNIAAVTQKLKPEDYIIVCCKSGARSAMAKNILKSKGYKNIVNGGGWASLDNKIKSR